MSAPFNSASIVVYASVAVLASIFLAGCIVSEQPLSQNTAASRDHKVLGTWVTKDGATTTTLDITFDESDKWYHIKQAMTRDDGTKPQVEQFRAFPTLTKRATYANLEIIDSKRNVAEYMIVRYKIAGKKLTIAALDYQKLADEIRANRLEGKAWETTWGRNVHLSAAPDKLLKLLEGKNGNTYFGQQLVYRRR